MPQVFSSERIVTSNEIDALNHVNNVIYVQWIQDVAGLHWNTLTKGQFDNDFVWVVIRHEIDYLKQAVLGDTITLKTWIGETKGFKSIRHVEIYKQDTLLVKAQTTWGFLDAVSFKPCRISEEIIELFLS